MNRKNISRWLVSAVVMMAGVCLMCLNTSCSKDDEEDNLYYYYWEESPGSYVRTVDRDIAFSLYKVQRDGENLVIEYGLMNVGGYNRTLTFYTHDTQPAAYDDTGRSYYCKTEGMSQNSIVAIFDGKRFSMYGWGREYDLPSGQLKRGSFTISNFSSAATMVSLEFYAVPQSKDVDTYNFPYRTIEFHNVPIEADDTGRTYRRLN